MKKICLIFVLALTATIMQAQLPAYVEGLKCKSFFWPAVIRITPVEGDPFSIEGEVITKDVLIPVVRYTYYTTGPSCVQSITFMISRKTDDSFAALTGERIPGTKTVEYVTMSFVPCDDAMNQFVGEVVLTVNEDEDISMSDVETKELLKVDFRNELINDEDHKFDHLNTPGMKLIQDGEKAKSSKSQNLID